MRHIYNISLYSGGLEVRTWTNIEGFMPKAPTEEIPYVGFWTEDKKELIKIFGGAIVFTTVCKE